MFNILLTVTISLAITTTSFGEYYDDCRNVAKGSYIAVENNCRAFIYCQDEETSFEDTCPEGTFFNAYISECVIDEDNICPAEEETEESEDTENETTLSVIPTNFPMLSTSTIYEHNADTTSRPQCNRYINAYYPHAQRCEYYFKCISGFLTIARCNFNYAWDYQKEMCLPSNMVKCYANSKLGSNAFKNFINKFPY